MIERADRDGIVLVDLPAGQTRRRTAFAIALALLGSAEVAAPFASVPLRQFEAFIPVSQTFIFVNDLITSVLLIAQFVIVRWRAILVLDDGTTLFDSRVIDVTQILTFSGTFTPTGLLGAGLQATGWLYELWHSGFLNRGHFVCGLEESRARNPCGTQIHANRRRNQCRGRDRYGARIELARHRWRSVSRRGTSPARGGD